MASVHADDDPHASECAGEGSPNDSDNDEGLYVETNANVTKLLTTRGSPDSNKPMNGDDYRISTLDTLEHAIHTLRTRKVDGSLTKEESNRLESLVEKGLDILGLDSEEAAESVTQEIQENKCAEGSSSACPLVVEDGNRKTLMAVPQSYSPPHEHRNSVAPPLAVAPGAGSPQAKLRPPGPGI